ncbi:hypothetical protein LOK49_LG08G00992 [Camellia lanceoleosa]|uniref:Uncharacterized protein n=1 Tax=Camellia lanceoleosa TaxID=1840588 RepID=A0ACC0GVT7_9ERIC|nr:hypothetical protein LOK49_LG08G00992 [Camellia lanceoleosa]
MKVWVNFLDFYEKMCIKKLYKKECVRDDWRGVGPSRTLFVQPAECYGVGNDWVIFVQSFGRFCLARGGHHGSHFNNLNRSMCVTRRTLYAYKKSCQSDIDSYLIRFIYFSIINYNTIHLLYITDLII